MKIYIHVLGVALLASVGCSNKYVKPTPPSIPPIPLKIAILADSQITTEYRSNNYLYRNMRTDSLENVAIRTTAQEHLSAEHLSLMLQSVKGHDPDFILYLGDAANSGCNDELDKFFKVIQPFRDQSGIPIFITTGNHDYLATGNQAHPTARVQACGSKNYYTKIKLMHKLSEFNRQSWELSQREHGKIKNYIDTLIDPSSSVNHFCRQHPEELQDQNSCYYGAILDVETEGMKTQIALTDTSDYKDVKFLPKLSSYFAFFGLRGSISWNEGQTDWFEKHLRKRDNIRIVASHYPLPDLGWTKFFMGRPGDLLVKQGYNLWLSAHTHNPSLDDNIEYLWYGNSSEGWKVTGHINIGSTTDFRPQAGIVNLNNSLVVKTPIPSLSAKEVEQCELALLQLNNDAKELVEYRLGLDKSYRREGYDPVPIRLNIDNFLTSQGTDKRDYWIKCLINLAAINESKT